MYRLTAIYVSGNTIDPSTCAQRCQGVTVVDQVADLVVR
jgi:hypothetical protein